MGKDPSAPAQRQIVLAVHPLRSEATALAARARRWWEAPGYAVVDLGETDPSDVPRATPSTSPSASAVTGRCSGPSSSPSDGASLSLA